MEVFDLGPRVATPTLYSESSNVCISLVPDASIEVYPVLHPASLPHVGFTLHGTGRLRAPLRIAADDPRPLAAGPLGQLLDTQRQALCWPTSFADGVLRCVSNDTATLMGFFADASCSTPLATYSGGCPMPRDAVEGTPVSAVLEVLGPYAGPIFVSQPGGGCSSNGVAAATDGYWVVGATVDLDTAFPKVAERTE
jgi:hypothetical protein